MATSYQYTATDSEGKIRVRYNVTPEYNSFVYSGETITIKGTARCTNEAITGFTLTVGDYRSGVYQTTSKRIAKGTDGSFTATLTVPDNPGFTGRAYWGQLIIEVETASSTVSVGSDSASENREHSFTVARYPLNFQLLDLDLGRCNDLGEWDREGRSLRCRKFRVSVNDEADKSEVWLWGIKLTDSNGQVDNFVLPRSIPAAAFTAAGYSEDAQPSGASRNYLFDRYVEPNMSYDVMVKLGDKFETKEYAAPMIPPALARLYISKAEKGGVAVGMVSSATDDLPKFEVAPNHETRFYGPVYFEDSVYGIEASGGGGEPGSKWYSGAVLTGSGTTSSSSLTGTYRVGDYYLNTTTGDFYRCTTAGSGSSARWTYQGNLQGPRGYIGEIGPYYAPSVSSDGALSWSNNGGLSNPTSVNVKGPKGDKGDGGDYYYPTVSSTGTLSWTKKSGTASSSTPASVNIRGPKGDKGDTGPAGPSGLASSIGFTTVTLQNSSSSPQTVSGTIPTVSGASRYICTGALGWNSAGRPGTTQAPYTSGTTLYAHLAGNSTVMFGILGIP